MAAHEEFDGKRNTWKFIKKGCFFINNKSPNWELNPGPSVYKTDALPLSYLGIAKHSEA